MPKTTQFLLVVIALAVLGVIGTVVFAVLPRWQSFQAMRRGVAQGDYTSVYDTFDKEVKRRPNDPGAYEARAYAAHQLGRHAEAVQDVDQALKLLGTSPKHPEQVASLYELRGQALFSMKRYAESITDHNKAVVTCREPGIVNNLAWRLATCPEASVRDGKRAVKLMLPICEEDQWKDGGMIDTLAAAYAEAGDFQKAVQYQQTAIKRMDAQDQSAVQTRLRLYQQGQAYREGPEVGGL